MDPSEVKFRFLRYSDSSEIPLTPRLEAFARRYIARWMKGTGRPPRSAHPFPNPWEPTFLIDFGEEYPPPPSEDDDNPASPPA